MWCASVLAVNIPTPRRPCNDTDSLRDDLKVFLVVLANFPAIYENFPSCCLYYWGDLNSDSRASSPSKGDMVLELQF